MTPLHTAEQCRQKVRDLIAEAVSESDGARREGLLEMADQWTEVARRRRQSLSSQDIPAGWKVREDGVPATTRISALPRRLW